MALPEDVLDPIPGDNPAGPYLRYDPVYDKIKEARRQDLDVPQGGWQTSLKTAEWPVVIKLSTETLAKRSKDLQIAAWLAEALLQRHGFSGLADGLAVLVGLLERFWDDLHPELEDGDAELRAVPLAWVGQYLDLAVRMAPITGAGLSYADYQAVRTVPTEEDAAYDDDKKLQRSRAIEAGRPTPEDFEKAFADTPKSFLKDQAAAIDLSLERVDALERLCDERFGDDAPSLIRLRQTLQEVRQGVKGLLDRKLADDPDPVAMEPEAEPESAPALEAEPADGDAAGATIGRAAPTASAAPTPTTESDAAARIAAAARFLRRSGPTNPAPYLMLRGYRWGELRERVGSIEATLLAAPPTEMRSRLKSLLLEKRWKELLEAAEEVMAAPYGRGWLDLQRYVITASDALGSEYDALGAALRGALRALLADRPELTSMTLMDDTPTANAETRQWLAEQGIVAEDAESAGRPGAQVGRRDALERALERVRAGHPEQAVELLMREAEQELSARDRFMRRLQAASIMVDAGYEPVALPLLQEMAERIAEHGLERWEAGDTIAQPLGLLFRCMSRIDGESSETRELFLRISRLSPMQAIRLSAIASNGGADE